MDKLKKPILVTQPTLPNLDEYVEKLKEVWESKWITNNGQFHKQFEEKLSNYLGVKHISVFSNGTLALMTAMQVLDLKGEVITTPYSFVATAHSMLWNKLTPVFCDVDPVLGNLDPKKIDGLITDKTTAIVPVHVYGNPCEMDEIESIAKKHNLKVIYDAAHAFGVTKNGKSILNNGDLSILSFHATKTFNTIEGGAIICNDSSTKKKIDYLKNFGFSNETTVVATGINAKMNELQAAYGLLQLNNIDCDIQKRKKVTMQYNNLLMDLKGVRILKDMINIKHNYSYYPIFIEPDYPLTRDELYEKLKENGVFGRRYFYPLISDFVMYKDLESSDPNRLPFATKLANQVICLPIYPQLLSNQIINISRLIKGE